MIFLVFRTKFMAEKFILLFCVFLSLSGVQANPTENNNRSALIIGIGKYNGPASDLLGVPADIESAKTIAKAMNISEKNITVLRDQSATKKNITEALQSFSKKAADGGRVFIYFSGHGTRAFTPGINGCVEGLLTYDYETITNSEMAKATQNLNKTVDKSIFMVDACHSGGVISASKTRSLEHPSFAPKFASKTASGDEICAPTNYKTRGFFGETQRLGAIGENVVFISAAKPDEVSWDEGPGRGGTATQAVRDCLLGGAKDVNASGAVSLEEIRQCAQSEMNLKMPGPIQTASTITVFGNRNLIPVASTPPVATSLAANQPEVKPPVVLSTEVSKPTKPIQAQPTKPPEAVVTITPPAKPIPITSAQEPQTASLATLQDVEAQRNPQRMVDVKLTKKVLKIDKDYLDLRIKPNHDGYLYLILLGSDKKSFYVLYPNKLEQNNFIKAGQTINLPSQSWQIKAAGPAGIDHILVMVSDSPRDLKSIEALGADPNSPFVYALNNLKGRGALIDYLTGKTLEGKSEKFAAKIVTVSEVQ